MPSKKKLRPLGRRVLLNIITGKKKMLFKSSFYDSILALQNCGFEIFMERMINGNLIISYSKNNRIDIYSNNGDKLRSFEIKITKIKTDNKMKKRCAMKYYMRAKDGSMLSTEDYMKFQKYMEGYDYVKVDSEGNILVFYNRIKRDKESYKFQLYSKTGKYLFDSKINLNGYKYQYVQRRLQIYYYKTYLYF